MDGAGSFVVVWHGTGMEGMYTGYGVFANGGYLVTPRYISTITDMNGKVVYEKAEEPFYRHIKR